MSTDDSRSPSLLSAESRGGDTSESGISFQTACMLAHIPVWMTHEGFTMTIREAVEDFEAAFFTPGFGMRREAVQAKAERITPALFKEVLNRFVSLDRNSPGTYQWFTLVCKELSTDLKPFENGLRRLRDPYAFYESTSSVIEASQREFFDRANRIGLDDETANFIFGRVAVRVEQATRPESRGLFQTRLRLAFPEFNECKAADLDNLHDRLSEMVASRKAKPILRKEVESELEICRCVEPGGKRATLRVHTASDDGVESDGRLRFSWGRFFGGPERRMAPRDAWKDLVDQLGETRSWIRDSGRPRRIRLSGERRLSCAIALGNAFNAVGGFVVEMEYRGSIWSTDQHASSAETRLSIVVQRAGAESGQDVAISVSIGRDIRDDVDAYLLTTPLHGCPVWHLRLQENITGPEHANAIAAELKEALTRANREAGGTTTHLFFAGPSHVALFLGHRLNTVGSVQCYEWSGERRYQPTCLLIAY